MSSDSAIVIDTGSGWCKAGFSGYNAPTLVFPSDVPTKQHHSNIHHVIHIGKEALHPNVLNLNDDDPPIQDLESIWHHVFHELLLKSETKSKEEEQVQLDLMNPILLSEPPLNPKSNREQTTQLMFETFSCPSLYMSISHVLSLYASGRTTGTVLDSGHAHSQVVSIDESYALPHTGMTSPIGGKHLTEYLASKIMMNSKSERVFPSRCCFHEDEKREVIQRFREMKEQMCVVTMNVQDDDSTTCCSPLENSFELPDGTFVTLGQERFQCPEVLFEPSVLGLQDSMAIHELVFNSISKCDSNMRSTMFGNIILSGGSTLFQGLAERLKHELIELVPSSMNVDVVALAERKYLTWMGGSILASLPLFQELWITKEEYKEVGSGIVHRKCF
ncbi:hypothetical protein C9374_014368 [Naegleria lovaniensis]|uniref:Actin n=1 Tax=Naegleria lovaniensis TaxID=51637 RepID=A0AA88GYZ1_NAELO|nr:uncharacterized protein C9374_014368 [Naegleria lovaniensis]KAG2388968.1 hypothetical protein C9374_014368 [Naegleria lovaniensis]